MGYLCTTVKKTMENNTHIGLCEQKRAEKWNIIFYSQPRCQNPAAKPGDFFLKGLFSC